MKTIEIIGDNYVGQWTKRRIACRGIVCRGKQILLSYETKTDLYMIPGGGTEGTESLEDCCQREISEETGVLVSVGEHYLTAQEFYEDWLYETDFFVCEPVGEGERKLTVSEEGRGLVSRWVDLDEALSIFSRYPDYASTNEEKRGIYFREYTALHEYIKRNSK